MDLGEDVLSCFVRSSLSSTLLHDLVGHGRASLRNPRTLVITADLPRGLYEIALKTAAASFPVESLMLPLKEWPSLKTVPAGPFDFDHTSYRMAVPTFRVIVDGRDCGLVWCEVPSPEDMRARRVRALCGFATERSGRHEIRLELPHHETRLRWSDVERLELRADERRSVRLGDLDGLESKRPRLFTNADELRRLAGHRDGVQQAILDNLVRQLQGGTDRTYGHRTVTAALVALVTGEGRWLEEAVSRTLALCERPYWGYHDVHEVMGWNNDRDAGMRLFETAVVYDWLHDRLAEEQRRTVRAKLAYHADLADRVTRLQKGYWYTRSNEAHGQGLWFGFASAALALLGEDSRAGSWLQWVHGNVLDALAHMPDDGITEWPVFNAQWLILTTTLLEQAMGRRLRGRMPFLRNFARSIGKLHDSLSLVEGLIDKLPMLLLWLARRHRDRRAQADALRHAQLLESGGHVNAPELDPLALVAYDPGLRPSKPSRPARAMCSQNGTVLCRGGRGKAQFVFRCGTPLTPRHHAAHVWIAQSWYHPEHAGSFGWELDGRTVIPVSVTGYRKRTRDANLVTIDGRGHRMDSRWLGGTISLEHVSRVEHFASGPGVTFCHSNIGPSYSEESGVLALTRRWVFFHEPALLVMHDVVAVREPRRLAWHAHTSGRWRGAGPLAFVAEVDGVELAIRALPPGGETPGPDGGVEGVAAEVSVTHYVPPYSFGLNAYKTLEWQPEAHSRRARPVDYLELAFRATKPAARWDLVTVMGPDAAHVLSCSRIDGELTTQVLLGAAGAVRWSQGGTIRIEALNASVEADLAAREGTQDRPLRWTFFGLRHIKRGAETQSWEEPLDAVWHPGENAPRIILPSNSPGIR